MPCRARSADVFSGIALNLSKPYEVGDWIVLGDGIEGRVVETNWRATHLLNASNDLVVLPNSGLAKAQAHQPQQPQPQSRGEAPRPRGADHGAVGDFRRHAHRAPQQQFDLLAPAPTVEIKSLDAQAIEFELSFRVKDFAASATPGTRSTT